MAGAVDGQPIEPPHGDLGAQRADDIDSSIVRDVEGKGGDESVWSASAPIQCEYRRPFKIRPRNEAAHQRTACRPEVCRGEDPLTGGLSPSEEIPLERSREITS